MASSAAPASAAAAATEGDGCCPPGSLPALVLDSDRKGKLAGTVETLKSGLKVYSVPPPAETTKGIIVMYDVHGFSGGRIKGVCDTLAAGGYHVVMPDVYGDELGVNDKGGFKSKEGVAFIKSFDWDNLKPKLEETKEFLVGKGVKSTGAIGFCWGAWVVFKLSAADMISAGASCHPSLKVGPYLHDDPVEDQTAAAKHPMLLCPAGNDPDNVKKDGSVQKGLTARGIECKVVEFPEMKHGWVPRGDSTVEAVARDVQAALEASIAFFKAHL